MKTLALFIPLSLALLSCAPGVSAVGAVVPSPTLPPPSITVVSSAAALPSPLPSVTPAAAAPAFLSEAATPAGRVTPVAVPATSQPLLSPTATLQPCYDPDCLRAAEHFWLERPIPLQPEYRYWIDATYPYGSTQNGQREPHHGGEFVNPTGTPILAPADGTVVVAGNDAEVLYGPVLNFYGNLVVLRLTQTYRGQPVFTLNGHMDRVEVAVGQRVGAGDLLGVVGQTGIAIGPHTHFEVRIGHAGRNYLDNVRLAQSF